MDERLRAIANAAATLPQTQVVAQSGDGFPKPGEGDVDLFLYADEVPSIEARENALRGIPAEKRVIEFFHGPAWGVGDLLVVDGVEVFLMWFTTAQAWDEAESILRGERLGKMYDQLYPTGRIASILKLQPLYERGDYLTRLKALARTYPDALGRTLVRHNLGSLWDTETFERALLRKEVLLYHQELEHGLDCFLQALFALNRVYFPSRKRTLEYIKDFPKLPVNCGERLLRMVKLGADAETLAESYAEWQALLAELQELAKDE